jgi:hypothetical protein
VLLQEQSCAAATHTLISQAFSYTHIIIHSSYNTSCTSTPRPQGSHLPSFHPVRHRSSHFPQSNSFFPNLTLTALCASHIHCPNSLRLLTRGVLTFIHSWKSSAHTQHGYSLPNVRRNADVSVCNEGSGFSGYVAVIECRRVHDERPSWATSGGQSLGSAGGRAARFFLPPRAKSALMSLHVRQLHDIC